MKLMYKETLEKQPELRGGQTKSAVIYLKNEEDGMKIC